MGFKQDAQSKNIASLLASQFLKKSVAALSWDVASYLDTATDAIMNAIQADAVPWVSQSLKVLLKKSMWDYGVFASAMRQAMDHVPPYVSDYMIAEIADKLGYYVFKVERGFFGDEDYLIMLEGYDPEDYCRSNDMDIEDLGEISDFQ